MRRHSLSLWTDPGLGYCLLDWKVDDLDSEGEPEVWICTGASIPGHGIHALRRLHQLLVVAEVAGLPYAERRLADWATKGGTQDELF